MRRTRQLLSVISEFMESPTERHWGYELSKRSGVRSPVLYRILQRMLDEGWLEDGWESLAEIKEKRPPRRYYELTASGEAEFASILLSAAQDEVRADLAQGFA